MNNSALHDPPVVPTGIAGGLNPPADRDVPSQVVHLVLPAYNEGAVIGEMLRDVKRLLAHQAFKYRVIVVDDGSADDTAELARFASAEIPVHVISHHKNRGLAAALDTGFRYAVQHSASSDIVVTMDADNTHPIGLIPAMVQKANAGHDVIVASRFTHGARIIGVPWHRNLMSFGVAILFKALFPIRGIRDYTCGFRAYKQSVLRTALNTYGKTFISEEGFSCMVDVLLKLAKLNLVMGEVPMVLRYDFKEGASKMNVGRNVGDTLKLALRRRAGVMN